jgi:hypothetical protein
LLRRDASLLTADKGPAVVTFDKLQLHDQQNTGA